MNYSDYSRATLLDIPWLEFDLPCEGRVLDAGSGTGWAIHALKTWGLKPIGVDLHCTIPDSLRATVVRLPFRDHTFDIVVCARTLHHVEEDARALREFARVLRPSGLLLLSVANRSSYTLLKVRVGSPRWTPNPNQPRYRLYSSSELTRLLNGEGFDVIGIRSCHFVPQKFGQNVDGATLQFFANADASLGINRVTARFGPLWVACGRKR